MLNRALFLDRDGVLLTTKLKDSIPQATLQEDDVQYINEMFPILEFFGSRGYLTIMITNQPDIARGKCKWETVNMINANVKAHFNDLYMCPHDDEMNCQCRKPRSGMLLQASEEHSIDLKKSFFIGDRWRDMEAGRDAGCQTIFIDYGYEETKGVDSDFSFSGINDLAMYLQSTPLDKW